VQLAPSGGAAAGGKPAPRAPARAAGEALVGRAGRRPASGAAPRAQVGGLSRALAVRTLQLEMEYVYSYLEEEALDIAQGSQAAGWLLFRQVRMTLFVIAAFWACVPLNARSAGMPAR